MITLIIVILAGLFLAGIDCFGSRKVILNGKIVSHQFAPGQTFVGNGVNSSGDVTVNVSSTSDEYVLIVESDGQFVKVETDINFFSTSKDSDSIEFYRHKGCITGWTWGYTR